MDRRRQVGAVQVEARLGDDLELELGVLLDVALRGEGGRAGGEGGAAGGGGVGCARSRRPRRAGLLGAWRVTVAPGGPIQV